MDNGTQLQPGSPEQLARIVDAAEKYYEASRKPIIVFWDEAAGRYRLGYQSLYKEENTIEVVRIPK